MEKRGWHIDRLQKPDGLHLMVTPRHADVLDDFFSDLEQSVAHVRRHPELARQGGAAMYGMASSVPLRGMVARSLMDMMTDMYGPEAKIPGADTDTTAGADSPLLARLFLGSGTDSVSSAISAISSAFQKALPELPGLRSLSRPSRRP